MTPVPAASEPCRARLLGLLLVAATLAVYAPVCRQPFVNFDDPIHVTQNPWLHPLTLAHLAHFWRAPYQGLYVPLSYVAFGLLSLSGFNPHAYHAANLVLHTANVLLVFALLRRLVRGDWPAFAGALLFALHPLQAESVAWVSELRGLLAVLFSFMALHASLTYAQFSRDRCPRSGWFFVAYLVCLAAALLSKPSAVAVPLMAWALDCGFVRRPFRRALLPLVTGLALIVPTWLITRSVQGPYASLYLPLPDRVLVAGDALAFYIGKLVCPLRLGTDYGRTPFAVIGHTWGHWTWLLPVAVAAAVWLCRRRFPLGPLAALLAVAALLPVLGLSPFMFQGFSTVADRYVYLAMLGPALAVAALAAQITAPRAQRALAGLGAACAVGLGALCTAQVHTWDSSETLFRHAVAANPNSPPMHLNLGVVLIDSQPQAALAQFDAALQLEPRYAEAWANRGLALEMLGDQADATASYANAVRLAPDYPKFQFLLHRALEATGAINAPAPTTGGIKPPSTRYSVLRTRPVHHDEPSSTKKARVRRTLELGDGAFMAPAHRAVP